MLAAFGMRAWTIGWETFLEWRRHRSGEMAGAMSFFASVALLALILILLYVIGTLAPQSIVHGASSNIGHFAGNQYGRALAKLLSGARHGSLIAPMVGGVLLLLSVFATAMQLQAALNFIWDLHDDKEDLAVHDVIGQVPTFLFMFGVSFVLIMVLLVGAGLEALMFVTHVVPFLNTAALQIGDFAASIVILTLLFVAMFSRLPPTSVSKAALWLGAAVTALMYERAQFFLALYLGSIHVSSLYADVGIGLAVLLWLYYSAQVVLVGANLTKVLSTHMHAAPTARIP